MESNHRCSADYHLGRPLPIELVEMIAAYVPYEKTPECKNTGSDKSNATLHSGDCSEFNDANATSGDDDSANEDNEASNDLSNERSGLFFNEGIYATDWIGEKFREDENRWRVDAARVGGR